jgi:hypothetical protein
MRRVEVVNPEEDLERKKPVIKKYELYHGWLPFYPPAYPGGPPDPRVYCDTRTLAYLSGAGTAHPELSGAHQYLIGLATISGGYPTWPAITPDEAHGEPGRPPTLDGDHSYLYPRPTPSSRSAPPVWTGEARCRDQCGPLAGGLSWAEVLPTGWAADSTSVGYVWLGGAPYVARCTADGLDIAPVDLPADLLALLVWLAGTVTGIDAQMMRAWVYAFGSARRMAVTRLLDAADMSPCYAGGASSLHPQCGWQWLWQPEIGSPAAAVQVLTYTTSGHYASRRCDVTLSMVDGAPHAEVAVGPSQQWGGALFVVWTPTGLGHEVSLIPIGSSAGGTEATVYAFTTTKGGVVECTRVAEGAGGTVSLGPTPTWETICEAGTIAASGGSSTRVGSGGWRLTGAVNYDGSIHVESARTITSLAASVTATETRSGHFNGGYPGDVIASLASPLCRNESHATTNERSLEWGSSYCRKRTGNLSSGGGAAALVLLPGDSGVVVTAWQGWGGGTATDDTRTRDYISIRARLRNSDVGAQHGPGFISNTGFIYNYYSNPADAWSYNTHSGYGANLMGSTAAPPGSWNEERMVIASTSGVMHSLSLTDWPGLKSVSAGALATAPLCRTTGGGQDTYSPTPSSVTWPGGLSSVATGAPAVDPIGAT